MNNIEFNIRRSIRYHTKRRRFFDKLHRIVVFLTVICGSSAFVALMSDNQKIATWVTLVITLVSLLDLAIDFSGKSVLHDNLQRKFSDLLNKTIVCDDSNQKLKELEVDRILIEKDEPTALKALNILCHNEQCIAQGHDKDLYDISFWRKLLRNFFSFDGWEPKLKNI